MLEKRWEFLNLFFGKIVNNYIFSVRYCSDYLYARRNVGNIFYPHIKNIDILKNKFCSVSILLKKFDAEKAIGLVPY